MQSNFKAIESWKRLAVTKTNIPPTYKKYGLVIIGIFVAIIIAGTHKIHTIGNVMSTQNKHYETILRELNDVSSIVHQTANSPAANNQLKAALQTLESRIIELKQSFAETATSADIQGVAKQITKVKEDIDLQMHELKKSISQSTNGRSYLDPSILPFHVISVDVIAGQPYVSINYANHISPLGMNDIVAGWQLISADYDSASAEFSNEKNQYIRVSINRA